MGRQNDQQIHRRKGCSDHQASQLWRIIAKLASKMFDREPVLALPVKGIQAGRSLARRLKAIAAKEGWFLKWSRSADSKTFYFWIEEEAD